MMVLRRLRLGGCRSADLRTRIAASAKPQAAILCVLCLFVTGCQSDPFQRAPLPVLIHPNPQAIREQFPRQLPDRFTSDDSVLLEFPFDNKLSVLVVLQVNREAGTFELIGLNQMGLQFFHVGGDRNGVAIRDAVPPLMDHKDILLSMARDIQRVYFDLAPDANFKFDISSTEVVYTHKTTDGKLSYRFGYEPPLLLEKQLAGCFGATWRVRYYDYRPGAGGKFFAHGIVVDDDSYHYRIIIKNRDWSVDEQ